MTRKTTEPAMPRTLAQAQEVLARSRPHRSAPLSEWLAFYRSSAVVYAEVAEIDWGHREEALAVAEQERERATKIETLMSTRVRPMSSKNTEKTRGDDAPHAGAGS